MPDPLSLLCPDCQNIDGHAFDCPTGSVAARSAAVRAVAEALHKAQIACNPWNKAGSPQHSAIHMNAALAILNRLASDPAVARAVVGALLTPEMLAEALWIANCYDPLAKYADVKQEEVRSFARDILRALTEDPRA